MLNYKLNGNKTAEWEDSADQGHRTPWKTQTKSQNDKKSEIVWHHGNSGQHATQFRLATKKNGTKKKWNETNGMKKMERKNAGKKLFHVEEKKNLADKS